MNNTHTSLFLMANLGSEMTRLFSAKEKNDIEKLRGATLRAQGIISQIEIFPEMKDRMGEIDKIKYIVEDCNKSLSVLNIRKKDIESYFLPFVLNLMKQNKI